LPETVFGDFGGRGEGRGPYGNQQCLRAEVKAEAVISQGEEGNGFVLVSGTPKGAGSLSPSPAANWPLICWIKIKEIIKYRGLLYWRNQLFNSPTKLMVA
jgi:hypothetical protein